MLRRERGSTAVFKRPDPLGVCRLEQATGGEVIPMPGVYPANLDPLWGRDDDSRCDGGANQTEKQIGTHKAYPFSCVAQVNEHKITKRLAQDLIARGNNTSLKRDVIRGWARNK